MNENMYHTLLLVVRFLCRTQVFNIFLLLISVLESCWGQMVPVDSDDLWHAYNLIAPGDTVMAVTVRYLLRLCASSYL